MDSCGLKTWKFSHKALIDAHNVGNKQQKEKRYETVISKEKDSSHCQGVPLRPEGSVVRLRDHSRQAQLMELIFR